MLRKYAYAALIGSCMLQASCFGGGNGGDAGGSTGGPTCSRAGMLLRSCALLTAGIFDCSEPDDAKERCEAECFLAGGCDDLELLLCEDEALVSGPQSATLETCLEACKGQGFVCSNGTTIEEDWRCDGFDDCGDSSDEADCSDAESRFFTCGSGEVVSKSSICDDFTDCGDGSDELDCPIFTCADGTEVPASLRCDEFPDCPGGEDEDGCAQFLCGGVPRQR